MYNGEQWPREAPSLLCVVECPNILLIYVTSLDTFHLLSGWLKEVASRNIYHIFVTLDTSQLLSGWLKDNEPINIQAISSSGLI